MGLSFASQIPCLLVRSLMQIRQAVLMTGGLQEALQFFLEVTWFHGVPVSRLPFLGLAQKLSTRL